MRTIVFTGDDFGFSSGVNLAIMKAHERGVLTRASLMVTGDAFEEAVALARAHPRLSVGLHLVLAKGRAVLSPSEIPHLVDRVGYFPSSSIQAGLRYQFDGRTRRELRAEICAQLDRFQNTGLRLSHLDGHMHMHMHPAVIRIVAEIAGEFNLREVRLPSEEFRIALRLDRTNVSEKVAWALLFGGLRSYGKRCLASVGVRYADRVYGLLTSGRMTEEHLLRLISQIRSDRVEVYSHPALEIDGEPLNGPPGSGQMELAALVSEKIRHALLANGFSVAAELP